MYDTKRQRARVAATVIVVVTTVAGFHALPATPATPSDALASQPNILVLVSDDQQCDQHRSRHCDSVDANMKFLASEPGGHWITSLQTRYHGSLCCPDRATFLTGQTNVHNKQFNNGEFRLDESETLATALDRSGYSTGLFGKYLNPYTGPRVPAGWDRWLAHRGSPTYYNFDVVDNGTTGASTTKTYKVPKTDDRSYDAYWLSARMNTWIAEQRTAGEPWFAYFSAFAPHSPGGSTTDVTAGEHSKVTPLPNAKEGCAKAVDTDASDKPTFVQANACTSGARTGGAKAMVSLDNAYERVFDNLIETGQLDDTIIFFIGDNGVASGSHNIKGKQCAYEECHTNPWMMRVPDRPSGTLSRLVSNVDLMPTILELTGATTTLVMDGSSMVPLLDGDTTGWRSDHYQHNGDPAKPAPDDYDTVRDDCVVHDPCLVYTEYQDGERELYDLTADPYQLTNLLANPTTGYPGRPGWNDSSPQVRRMVRALEEHEATGR